jgi:hypothetical protein
MRTAVFVCALLVLRFKVRLKKLLFVFVFNAHTLVLSPNFEFAFPVEELGPLNLNSDDVFCF